MVLCFFKKERISTLTFNNDLSVVLAFLVGPLPRSRSLKQRKTLGVRRILIWFYCILNLRRRKTAEGKPNERETEDPHMHHSSSSSSFEINYSDLTFDQAIGGGNFGRVYKGTYKGADVAIKRLELEVKNPDLITTKPPAENRTEICNP